MNNEFFEGIHTVYNYFTLNSNKWLLCKQTWNDEWYFCSNLSNVCVASGPECWQGS